MDNLSLLEICYKNYIRDLSIWLPEGIIDVNLELLWRFDLVNYLDDNRLDPALTRYFHVIETVDKITLVNDDFVVWIVPEIVNDVAKTFILIALNKPDQLKLELVFSTAGVYNTSKLVLRLLEKFLMEIQENEEFLSDIRRRA